MSLDSFINIHSHDNPEIHDVKTIQSVLLQDVDHMMINIEKQYSLSVHPWYLDEPILFNLNNRLLELLKTYPFIAIGECGLDKKCKTPFSVQIETFKMMVSLADKFEKPLIIHCVKAVNEIIAVKIASKSNVKWIFHGFESNKQMAEMLIRHGFYLSFGKALFKQNVMNVFENIPLNRIFLETDISEYSIEQMYVHAAKIKNITLEQLKTQIISNFETCFNE